MSNFQKHAGWDIDVSSKGQWTSEIKAQRQRMKDAGVDRDYWTQLCGTNSSFKKQVGAIRTFVEAVQYDYGKVYSTGRTLWKQTCWAHHGQSNPKYGYTYVDDRHMRKTVDNLEEFVDQLIEDETGEDTSDDSDSDSDSSEELAAELGELSLGDQQGAKPCHFYNKGHCRFGTQCKFAHSSQ
eukprot:m.119417 g.119417  ORF g.119417 m.119417 type:complete len:182 (+) comp13676_c1_seq7:196-741(+)